MILKKGPNAAILGVISYNIAENTYHSVSSLKFPYRPAFLPVYIYRIRQKVLPSSILYPSNADRQLHLHRGVLVLALGAGMLYDHVAVKEDVHAQALLPGVEVENDGG